jgi:hypothetical protein
MSNALETALLGTLTGGTALTALLAGGTASVYNGQPPRAGVMPWVVFSLASGVEENMTPTDSQRYVYLVKGVAPSLYTAGLIAEQAHLLLQHTHMTITGSACFWAARETVVRYQEVDPAGHVIGHAGGEYVFRLEKT